MIQPISNRLLQTGKYFSILKFMILQQNISSVWIFGDQSLWYQQGLQMDGVLQHLVGPLPKYILDFNSSKGTCVNNHNIKILNIFFVSQSLGSKELNCICPADYTMVLVQNSSTKMALPENLSSNILQRIVFGTISNSTIVDVTTFHDKPMKDLFTTSSRNLNASTFRILFHIQPPHSFVLLIDKTKFFFSGPEAQMAEEITKRMNATALIHTDFGLEYPNFTAFHSYNDPQYLKSLRLLKFHKLIKSSLTVSDFYQNYSNYADLYITEQLIKGSNKEINEFLYPHTRACLRIVVPRIQEKQGFAEKLFNNSVVQSICLIALLMFISKIILNRSHRVHDWIETFFTVIAAILGQKCQNTSSKLWETIWNVQLTFTVIFSTAALSAISYQTLVSVKYVRQIDTLNDLMESNLTIFAQKSMSEDFKVWGSGLDPRLWSNIVYQSEMMDFKRNETNDVAYVWDDAMAEVHVMQSQYSSRDGHLSGMRLAMEPLYCGLSSARVGNGSPFKHSIDQIVNRMFESGIKTKHLQLAIQYYNAKNSKIPINSGNKFRPLTFSQSYGIFVLLIGGIAVGCVVFVLEVLWNWLRMRKEKIHQRCILQRSVG